MVTVEVGGNIITNGTSKGKAFTFHKHMLTENSGYFRRELARREEARNATRNGNANGNRNVRTNGTKEEPVKLPDVFPVIFGYLNQFLYSQDGQIGDHVAPEPTPSEVNGPIGIGNLPAARLSATSTRTMATSSRSDVPTTLPSLTRFFKLWMLADKLEFYALADYAAYKCIDRVDHGHSMSSPDLKINFEMAKPSSMQRKFLVDYMVWGCSLKHIRRYDWPKNMLVEIMQAIIERIAIESRDKTELVEMLVRSINTMAVSIGKLENGAQDAPMTETLVNMVEAMAKKIDSCRLDGVRPENPLMDVTNYYRQCVHSAESYLESQD